MYQAPGTWYLVVILQQLDVVEHVDYRAPARQHELSPI